MSSTLMMAPIGSIDIPKDKPRKTYSPAGFKRLKESIEFVGILAPLVVRRMPNKRFELIDGSSRLEAAHELGWDAAKKVPLRVFNTDERGRIAAEVVLNQIRERLPASSELYAVRKLLKSGASQKGAAKLLGRTRAWASQMASLDRLPAHILKQVDDCEIPTTHALVMVPYVDHPEIIDLIAYNSVRGDASTSNLKLIAEAALKQGMTAAEKQVPKNRKVGKSHIRVEPRSKGLRIEINLHHEEDFEKISAKVRTMVNKMRASRKKQ